MRVQFKGWNCVAKKMTYATNGRVALMLYDVATGERIATATVNVPDEPLEHDEVCIKNYAENQGMLDALVDGGVVEKPHFYCQTGYVIIPVCRLMI